MRKKRPPQVTAENRPRKKQRVRKLVPKPAMKQSWRRRHMEMLLVVGIIALGTMRIVSTYTVYNHTVDEPAHIASGMEWLEHGSTPMEVEHPPLAREMAALGPYLSGVRLKGIWEKNPTGYGMFEEGENVYYTGDNYDRTLILSRLGILPFFWIGCLAVYFWARRYFGNPTAMVSLGMLTFLPAILAHAGLGTTDMAVTAFMGAAFMALLFWADNPTLRNSALLGAAGGLAVLSKFSSLVFFPAVTGAALLIYLVAAWPGFLRGLGLIVRRVLPLAAAVVVAALVVWAGYDFHYGPTLWPGISLPAPELYNGIKNVIDHNHGGHSTYLFGQYSIFGWWYFFPVVLAVKTPLPFLALAGFGAVISLMRWREKGGAYLYPLGFALAILGVGMASHIDVGVRHILPIYLGLSIVAAVGTVRLYELSRAGGWVKAVFVILVGWFALTSLGAHPDYLPYFNALAGDEPERIMADSDLDWGQDMTRTANRLHELGVTKITFMPLVFDFYDKRGFPELDYGSALVPSPGWNAVSITGWKILRWGVSSPQVPWPDDPQYKPFLRERVGKGILLYYFPEKDKK